MDEEVRDFLIYLIAVPVIGLLMGGIYSLPAMRITNGREPWLTILLSVGLSTTVIAIGFACGLSIPVVAGAWGFACVALVVRRCFGKLDHSVERFGLIHALTLVGMYWLVQFAGR